jgi:hypothetical protein
MLSNIFYFIGLFVLLSNLLLITRFLDYLFLKEFYNKFQKVTGKKPEKKDLTQSNYDFLNFLIVNTFFTVVWFFIGLLSNNWLIFLLYFIYNPIIEVVYRSNIKFISNSVEFIRVLLDVSIVGLLVINHFHLHLNLTSLILH